MPTPTGNLIFAQPPAAGSPTPLVFGDYELALTRVDVAVAVTLSGQVTVSATVSLPVRVEVLALLSGTVSVSASVFYDNRVTPYLDCRVLADHQPAQQPRPIPQGSFWVTSEAKRNGTVLPWTPADAKAPEATERYSASVPKFNASDAPWTQAIRKAQASAAAHQKAVFKADGLTDGYQLGVDRRVGATGRLQTGVFKAVPLASLWQVARPTRKVFDHPMGASLWFAGVQASDARWQMAGWPMPGLDPVVPVDPVVPPVFYWDANLLFECPPLEFPNLVFGAQACYLAVLPEVPFYILPARFYMTTHTIFAETMPGLAEVPIYDATVSADAGSYCWTLSASGPASLFTQLAPVDGLPVRLRVWLDGLPFVFAIDSISRSQKFGQTGVNVSGRSVTALIGAPYLRATTRDNAAGALLAQQLALAALATTGIDLDWGLTDWLVPAGAWSHQGTPLDAVQAIAQAAGGYLQSDRFAPQLLTRHPYGQRAGDNPGAPWSWMTGPADVELAPDAIVTEGLERRDGPNLNAVYVSGTTQGVLGLVKRTGSAADKLGAMVTDPLITHVAAARQRGLSVLGAAGGKYHVRLELPVLTGAGQPGVLDVGQLVQINASTPWRGRVRAVSVNAKRPSLRQTVTLERHLETV